MPKVKPDKKRFRENLMKRLETLYVLFPKNHPLRVKETYTQWNIPARVKLAILQQVEGVILTAYQRGKKVGYEKGLIDGAIAAKETIILRKEQ